ncbi:MAG: hypothetical protein JSV27_04120 [Candidatus Bathyarchaeota archaeon]|nr:MAG: hypothetical protein JSV27_04120 [Candidatus Bathyarchaeota archaeon]
MVNPPFKIKVRIGEIELELAGEKSEVYSTLDDLEEIVNKVTLAFNAGPRPRSVRIEAPTQEPESLKYPKIGRTNQCGEAVIALLSSDWGKTPRAIGELREAMEANAIFFPKTTLSGVLVWLVKKGQLRRWKDKKRGYLYVTNEQETE